MDPSVFKVVGKVKGISKDVLTVYAVNSNQTYKIVCPFKCSVNITDTISGFCRPKVQPSSSLPTPSTTSTSSLPTTSTSSLPTPTTLLEYIIPPFIQLSVDKDSIISCLYRALGRVGGRHQQVLTIYQFYDKCVEQLTAGKLSVDDYLNELSVLWNQTKDDSLFRELYPCSGETCTQVCEFWYTKRVCRQLKCLGLTMTEIFEIKNWVGGSLNQVKSILLKNPYLVYTIPLDKADRIVNLAGLGLSTVNRECGKIVRELFSAMQKGWMGIPLELAYKKWKPMFPHLLTEFNCCIDNSTLYLKSVLNIEVYVARQFEQFLERPNDSSGPLNLRSTNLTEEQKIAIHAALTQPLTCIVGSAGTGKTTCIREIVSICKQRKLNYLIGSYTGKAVARVQEVIGANETGKDCCFTSTIHRCVHKSQEIAKFDILIIDEASMMTTDLFYQLLTRFPHRFSCVLIGDPNQLEPIGGGSLFEETLKSRVIPTYKLTTVQRTHETSGITKNANKILEYISPNTSLGPFEFETSETFQMSSGSIGTVVELLKDIRLSSIKTNDFCLITPYTRDVDALNLECQKIFSSPLSPITDEYGFEWKLYDRVSLKANRYDIGLMNGAEGEITKLSKSSVEVTFTKASQETSIRHWFSTLKSSPSKTKNTSFDPDPEGDPHQELTTASLRLSYCLTIHRSQGSEWKYVILYVLPAPKVDPGISLVSKIVLHRKLIYTALTRAKTCIWCIGDLIHLQMAATKPAPIRCDNLSKRLSHVDEEIVFI